MRPHASRSRILRTRILWFSLAGLAVFVMLRRSAQTASEAYRTSADVLRLEQELTDVQREHDELQGRLESLGTAEGKRMEAAHQLKLVRPGEHLLTVREDDETREAMSSFDAEPSRADQPLEVIKRMAHSPSRPGSGDSR
jgi:hypothetical protein